MAFEILTIDFMLSVKHPTPADWGVQVRPVSETQVIFF